MLNATLALGISAMSGGIPKQRDDERKRAIARKRGGRHKKDTGLIASTVAGKNEKRHARTDSKAAVLPAPTLEAKTLKRCFITVVPTRILMKLLSNTTWKT